MRKRRLNQSEMQGIAYFSVDAFIIVVFLVSFIIGWVRGATKEVLSVIAWCGGIYLTILLFPHAKEFTRGYISHKLIADFVTICGLFILFLTALSVFNYFCSNLVKKSMLNTADKALGGIFGIFRGGIILVILDLIFNQYLLSETPQIVKDSKFRPAIASLTNFTILVLPENLQEKILAHMSQVKKQSFMNFVKDSVMGKIAPDEVANIFKSDNRNNVEAESAQEANKADKVEEEYIEDDDIPVTNNTQSAEELATLKPKKLNIEKSQKDISKKSRNDMKRLLSQYE